MMLLLCLRSAKVKFTSFKHPSIFRMHVKSLRTVKGSIYDTVCLTAGGGKNG